MGAKIIRFAYCPACGTKYGHDSEKTYWHQRIYGIPGDVLVTFDHECRHKFCGSVHRVINPEEGPTEIKKFSPRTRRETKKLIERDATMRYCPFCGKRYAGIKRKDESSHAAAVRDEVHECQGCRRDITLAYRDDDRITLVLGEPNA